MYFGTTNTVGSESIIRATGKCSAAVVPSIVLVRNALSVL